MSVEVLPFSTTRVGHDLGELVRLTSPSVEVTLRTLGAAVHTVRTPDRDGRLDHVHLFLEEPADYLDHHRNPHLGTTVGRYANRIEGSAFELDGQRVELIPNEGPNQLHGGPDGFDRRVWALGHTAARPDGAEATMILTSPDGDQGYPGTLETTATFVLAGSVLTITFEATTDAPTVVNLCSHGYWNLSGPPAFARAGSIRDHVLRVEADRFLPVDAHGIPDGALVTLDDDPRDLRAATTLRHPLQAVHGGLDHAYALHGGAPLTDPVEPAGPAHGSVAAAATLIDPISGRTLTVRTDQPALQVYSGDHLGEPFAQQAAICLEPQLFPNTPNRPDLGTAVLRPGERYAATTVLAFGTVPTPSPR